MRQGEKVLVRLELGACATSLAAGLVKRPQRRSGDETPKGCVCLLTGEVGTP